MAKADSIAPFPADVDRESFGYWLSGFADGEACFDLNMSGRRLDGLRTPSGRFMIELRRDDRQTLLNIQSFLGCGGFYERLTNRAAARGLTTIYRIQKIADLATIVVPHFDRFPLRSKKNSDYAYWREAALLAHNVNQRPLVPLLGRGRSFKWLSDEIHRFRYLMETMREQRKYHPQTMQRPCS